MTHDEITTFLYHAGLEFAMARGGLPAALLPSAAAYS